MQVYPYISHPPANYRLELGCSSSILLKHTLILVNGVIGMIGIPFQYFLDYIYIYTYVQIDPLGHNIDPTKIIIIYDYIFIGIYRD